MRQPARRFLALPRLKFTAFPLSAGFDKNEPLCCQDEPFTFSMTFRVGGRRLKHVPEPPRQVYREDRRFCRSDCVCTTRTDIPRIILTDSMLQHGVDAGPLPEILVERI
jgi:hypothetical protein